LVFQFRAWDRVAACGNQWPDHLFADHQQGRHRANTLDNRCVAAGPASFDSESFAAQLVDVVSGAAGALYSDADKPLN
jgi:hypothetical protein